MKMKKSVKVITISCSIIVFIGSKLWYCSEGGYEPFIGIFGSFSIVVGVLFVKEKKKTVPNMTQQAGDSANQYQAGRNMKIN
jgi:hypothetical protein